MNAFPSDKLDRIVQADALDYLAALPAESVNMVWTDPPYGNNNGVGDLAGQRAKSKVKGGRQKGEVIAIANDDLENWTSLMPAVIQEIDRVLKKQASCCCCCCCGGGPTVHFARVADWLALYHDFFQAVVWDKSARGNGMGWRYRRNYEFVMVSHKKGGRLAWNENRTARPNVVRSMPVYDRIHENEKPLELVTEFILNHTQPGDLVLDPFMGSGTTALAARNTGRHFAGCDSSAEYVALANKRLALPYTVPMFERSMP